MKKLSVILLSVFLSLTSCGNDEDSSFTILLNNQHQKSKFKVIIEDYTNWAWASLYNKSEFSVKCSGFLWGTITPIKDSEVPELNGNPPISDLYASKKAFVKERPKKSSIELHWSDDGKAVVIFVNKIPFCLLDGMSNRCFTKAVKQAGPYGLPWDETIYLELFEGSV